MTKWFRIEDENFVVIVPEDDKLPHGTKISDSEYELTNECACNPTIKTGDQNGLYVKPLVIHHSFEDKERVYKALKNPKIEDAAEAAP